MPDQANRKRHALKDGQFQEVPDSEIEYELTSPTKFGGSHLNLIPLQSSMQGTRGFYGARFANQALPVVGAEAPLVQNLDPEDPEGRSFDDKMGEFAGAIRADKDGVVQHLDDDKLQVQYADGKVKDHELYHSFPFNRKTNFTHVPLVKLGDKFKKGQMLARSNYTDDKGTLAMGLNARIGLVPYKGHSMDDAIVISESFAKRLKSSSLYGHDLDYKRGVKGGKAHYTGVFPHKFINDQLNKLDDEGVVKPGQILQPGDPMILATRPRVISSTNSQLGLLSKHMKNARSDAAVLWDHESPGKVVDVHKLRSGVKVNISSEDVTHPADKIVLRSGNKGVISEIIPDDRMPRTADGKPLEVLLNQLGIPSRVNSSLLYELLLGKVAAKTGKAYRVPSFNQPGEKWFDQVRAELDKAGLSDTEDVFDPALGKKLENPITVGNGYILKLHHTSESKISARGQGAYDNDQQPVHGGGELGQCFAPKQVINTAEGPMEIARLCEKRLRVNVKTWDMGRKEWIYRPVTDWFIRRSKIEDLINIYFSSNCDRHNFSGHVKMYNQVSLLITKNHLIYTPDGLKPAGDFKVGDTLLTWGPEITDDQRQLLIGSMLGDAYAHCSEDAIRIEHGAVQANYVKFKQSILSGLGGYHLCKDREASDSSIVFKLTNKRAIKAVAVHLGLAYVTKWARRLFYPDGKKRVTPVWLSQLNDFGFSILVLDDGSVSNQPSRNRFEFQIATDSFSIPEVEMLRDWVKNRYAVDLGINCMRRLITSKRADVMKIMDVVAEWIPWEAIPHSKASLIKHCKEKQSAQPCRSLNISNKLGLVPVEILDISPYVHDKPGMSEINVYDFTVAETHNYCASSILVSNSKRLSGLESNALLSSGAYNVMREGATLRGTRADEYWRQLRQGYEPREPGSPFIWSKFKALLSGSGHLMRHLPNGKDRLQFFTDKDLEQHKPLEVETGDIVDLGTMEPVKHGLFDPALTGGASWGKITLPHPIPNPAAEKAILRLLGLTEKQYRDVIAGTAELPPEVRGKMKRKS